MTDVLEHDVDVDPGVTERTEDRRRDPRLVGDPQQRHLGNVGLVRYRAHLLAYLHLAPSRDDCPRFVVERGSDADLHRVRLADLDRARMHDPSARGRQLEHLVVVDRRDHARVGDDARVGRVHARDVGEDLAAVGADRHGERDRRGVGAAATERRDVHVLGRALEAGDHHDVAAFELIEHALRDDVDDPRRAVRAARPDAGLRAGERDRRRARRVQRHREQRSGDRLAAAEQHVHLARRWIAGDAMRERDELVGGVAHGADHHHHLGAGHRMRLADPARNATQLDRRRDARSAVLLDHAGHDETSTRVP